LPFPFVGVASACVVLLPAWDHWPARMHDPCPDWKDATEGLYSQAASLPSYPTLPLQKLHNLTVDKWTQQARAWVSVL